MSKSTGPVAPPSVTAAILLIRTAVHQTMGMSVVGAVNKGEAVPTVSRGEMGDVVMQAPMSLWVKSPNEGKVAFRLGKKRGNAVLPVPETEEGQAELLGKIQEAVNDLIKDDKPITCYSLPRPTFEEAYGPCVAYDTASSGEVASKKKPPKPKKDKEGNVIPPPPPHDRMGDNVAFAYSPGVLFGATINGGDVSPTTGCVGSIDLEIGKGMKGSNFAVKRECDLTIKFTVSPKDASAVAPVAAGGHPGFDDAVGFLMEKKVSNKQGAELVKAAEDSKVVEVTKAVADVAVDGEGSGGDPAAAASVVNPWEVTGKVDYAKLIDQFGSQALDEALLQRLEAAIKKIGKVDKLHRFIRRGIFFSHRDLNLILDCVEKGQPFYLYTGRGPSSTAMHLGHLVPFMMTQWLQKAFDVPLVIQMTDDEKFLWKGKYENGDDNLLHFCGLTIENAKDIIACGFDKEKTFIFSDCEYVGHMYPNICRIWKSVTYSTAKAMFGFQGDSNIGQSAFPAIQAAPSFPSSFAVPLGAGRDSNMACLIPCAIDQDPYFRMTRDVAHKLTPATHPLKGKPALFHSKFFPPLQGATGKMSSSDDNSAIFLTDTPEQIAEKIKTHAFSGGRETGKLQRELGADLDVDVSYQWLNFFLEDDEELAAIGKSYGSGQGDYWATGMVKNRLVELLQGMVKEHQERRKIVDEITVKEWMAVRKLNF